MMRRCCRPLVLVLALGSLPPLMARADEPTKELRVPPAPSQYLVDTLAELKAALPPDLLPSFAVVVADARLRLAASERTAAEGNGERITVADACRAALVDADFAGASKRKGKQLDALVQLTALQLGVDLHAALRERVGRQLAIRAVRACNDATACLDAITPTNEMTAEHVAFVRKQFERKGKELESADRLGNFEIQQLTATYQSTMSRVKTSDKQQKAVLDFIKG